MDHLETHIIEMSSNNFIGIELLPVTTRLEY